MAIDYDDDTPETMNREDFEDAENKKPFSFKRGNTFQGLLEELLVCKRSITSVVSSSSGIRYSAKTLAQDAVSIFLEFTILAKDFFCVRHKMFPNMSKDERAFYLVFDSITRASDFRRALKDAIAKHVEYHSEIFHAYSEVQDEVSDVLSKKEVQIQACHDMIAFFQQLKDMGRQGVTIHSSNDNHVYPCSALAKAALDFFYEVLIIENERLCKQQAPLFRGDKNLLLSDMNFIVSGASFREALLDTICSELEEYYKLFDLYGKIIDRDLHFSSLGTDLSSIHEEITTIAPEK